MPQQDQITIDKAFLLAITAGVHSARLDNPRDAANQAAANAIQILCQLAEHISTTDQPAADALIAAVTCTPPDATTQPHTDRRIAERRRANANSTAFAIGAPMPVDEWAGHPLIVVGPAGAGNSLAAQYIAQHFHRVMPGNAYWRYDSLDDHNIVFVTTAPPGRPSISFEKAARVAGILFHDQPQPEGIAA